MALAISNFVNVAIAIAVKAAAKKGFGTLVFTTPNVNNKISILERYRIYDSMEAVTADFPSGEVYEAATAYYSQNPTPNNFIVLGVFGTNTPATLTGSAPATLAAMKAITAGGFDITVNGTIIHVSAVNLSAATDYAGIATIISSKLGSVATCTYTNGAFKITTALASGVATLTYANADVQDLAKSMGLLSTTGGILTQGSTAEKPVDALSTFTKMSYDGYGIVLDKMYRDSKDAEDVAAWAQANKKVFFNTTNDANTLLATGSCIASNLKDQSMSRTMSIYSSHSDEYPCCSIAGRAFTVNFEGTNTTITLMYKKMPGITVENLGPSQYNNMVAKNCNANINVADNYMFAEGMMADGTWFDTIHGVDWLSNAMQTNVFNLLYQTTTKIPYTDAGVGMVVQKMEQSLRQAVRNGLLAPGTTSDGTYLPLGYQITTVPVSEVDASDKGARMYKGITFVCVGAGALQGVTITGSFSE